MKEAKVGTVVRIVTPGLVNYLKQMVLAVCLSERESGWCIRKSGGGEGLAISLDFLRCNCPVKVAVICLEPDQCHWGYLV